MNLWSTRESAMEALATSLNPQAACLGEVFSLIDESIRRLHPLPPTLPIETRELAGIAAVVAIKGRNATLGIYGLRFFGVISDGCVYFRTDAVSRADYIGRGMRAFQPLNRPRGPRTVDRNFEVPEDVLADAILLRAWALRAASVSA